MAGEVCGIAGAMIGLGIGGTSATAVCKPGNKVAPAVAANRLRAINLIFIMNSCELFGYWLLVTGYWLLVTGYWLLGIAMCCAPIFGGYSQRWLTVCTVYEAQGITNRHSLVKAAAGIFTKSLQRTGHALLHLKH
jgi:hypothetical protein